MIKTINMDVIERLISVLKVLEKTWKELKKEYKLEDTDSSLRL